MNKIAIAERNTMGRIQTMGGGHLLAKINHIYRHGTVWPIRLIGTTIPMISFKNLEAQLLTAIRILGSKPTTDQQLLGFAQQALAMYYEELRRLEASQAPEELPTSLPIALQVEPERRTVCANATTMVNQSNFHSDSMVKAAQETPNISADTKPEKPNASIIAREVVNKHHFALRLNGIFYWTVARYKLVSSQDIRRLLNDEYRQEAERVGFAKFYDQVIDFILCERNLVVDSSAFDAITYLIAFRNGFLDTRSMIFHAPDPRLFFTSNVNLDFDNRPCECPNFDRFLAEIMGGDQAMVARIYEAIGLTLSNDLNRKALFVCQGVTNSGKSSLIKFIAGFFDEELTTALAVDDMDRSNFALAEMIGKALCMDTELAATPFRPGSVKKMKQLTSADAVNTDLKYRDRVSYISRAKIFLATNHLFQLDHPDGAFMKRIVAIPFYYEIPLERMISAVWQQFEQEKLAIAKKAIAHYCRLRDNKYIFSGDYQINDMPALRKESKTAVEMLAGRDDLIRSFLEKCCTLTTMDHFETTDALHKAYTVFCEQYGAFPVTQKLLTSVLKEMLGDKVESTKRRVVTGENPKSVLLGINLKYETRNKGGQH